MGPEDLLALKSTLGIISLFIIGIPFAILLWKGKLNAISLSILGILFGGIILAFFLTVKAYCIPLSTEDILEWILGGVYFIVLVLFVALTKKHKLSAIGLAVFGILFFGISFYLILSGRFYHFGIAVGLLLGIVMLIMAVMEVRGK